MAEADMQQTMLTMERRELVAGVPFEGDLLDRQALASKMTKYLDRLREGAVLAIDAQWGDGKSWFARNWCQQLRGKEGKHKSIYIDAFQNDYIEDPFQLIAAELGLALESAETPVARFNEKAAAVMRVVLPFGGKVLLNAAGSWLLGTQNFSDKIEETVDDALGDATDALEEWAQAKFEQHEADKAALNAFRSQLREYAAVQESPVVVFIDELDRCRPTFAVHLLERIKHFFDVPNLVFVLFLNRNQLEAAIRGVYGADTDASEYLNKFVNFFFKLPRRFGLGEVDRHADRFVHDLFERYKFPDLGKIEYLEMEVVTMCRAFNLSLRQLERVVALCAFAYPHVSRPIAYLAALKVKYPQLFARLALGEERAHSEAGAMLAEILKSWGAADRGWLAEYHEWHRQHANNFQAAPEIHDWPDIFNFLLSQFSNKPHREVFGLWAKRVDLPIA